ncbi:MAG: hypothetical protein MZU79_04050 [Anaerotruncus sp.]|nr:hypothetical protein [Anaerotruncus sp.]
MDAERSPGSSLNPYRKLPRASRSCSTSASPTAGSSWPPTSTATPRAPSTTASATTSAASGRSSDPELLDQRRGQPDQRPDPHGQGPGHLRPAPRHQLQLLLPGHHGRRLDDAQFETQRLNQGRITFFAEDRGSNHYPMVKNLDLRLEKVFTMAKKYRLGRDGRRLQRLQRRHHHVLGHAASAQRLEREADYPSTDGHELYSIVRPRQARARPPADLLALPARRTRGAAGPFPPPSF